MTKTDSLKRDNSVIGFFKQVYTEIHLVTWPTKQQTVNLTIMVIVVSVIVASYLGALDYLFAQLLGLIIKS